jgi:hypothetical protein
MQQNKLNYDDFLEALLHLPVIRKQLMIYAQEIIQTTKIESEEKSINDIIKKIKEDLYKMGKSLNDNDELLIEHGLKTMLNTQITLSRIADKIRKGKGSPPEMFK